MFARVCNLANYVQLSICDFSCPSVGGDCQFTPESLCFQMGDLRIALRQKKRVKVNHRTVELPVIELGKVSINQDPNDNYNVHVKLSAIGKTWLVRRVSHVQL